MYNMIALLKEIGATGIVATIENQSAKIVFGFGHSMFIIGHENSNITIAFNDRLGLIAKITCQCYETSKMYDTFFGKHVKGIQKGKKNQIQRKFPNWKISACDYGLVFCELKTTKFYICTYENGLIEVIFDDHCRKIFKNFRNAYPFLKKLY